MKMNSSSAASLARVGQSNPEPHFLCCINNPGYDLGQAVAERKAKAAQLIECRCDRYTDEAIKSANQNIQE
jgi:hypothetical protein